jgi:DNA polymerase-3 subunit epsilon
LKESNKVKLQQLTKSLRKGIPRYIFKKKLYELYPDLNFDIAVEFLKAQGLRLIEKNAKFYTATHFNNFKDEIYCVVDIETNGSKPENSQIIEIGAVKIKNGKIIATFNELVKAEYIPNFVQNITGITEDMLKNQKSQKEVLIKFKEFLGDAIFVAHDSYFDFNYIRAQLKKEELGDLLNPEICTLTLSKKTIKANRYGLKYLIEELDLPEEKLHRALSDAKTTSRIMLISFDKLPDNIKKTDELLDFAKGSKTIKNKILFKQKSKKNGINFNK